MNFCQGPLVKTLFKGTAWRPVSSRHHSVSLEGPKEVDLSTPLLRDSVHVKVHCKVTLLYIMMKEIICHLEEN